MFTDLFQTLGIIGMVLLLIAFVLGQLKIWREDDLIYDLTNFIGGSLLVAYAVAGWAVPFIVLELVWAGYSLHDVIMDMKKKPEKKHHLLKSRKTLKTVHNTP